MSKPLFSLCQEWRAWKAACEKLPSNSEGAVRTRLQSIAAGNCADALEARLRELAAEISNPGITKLGFLLQPSGVCKLILGVSPPPEKESQG